MIRQQTNLNNKIYNTAIYCRLSKDDGTNTESISIGTQKDMLTNYAKEQGFNIVDVYIDDGVSGKDFNRPAFQRLIEDIKNKKINCLLTRDLSRLGRNYIETGMYIEMFFPENDVRYIAVLDNVDTESSTHSNTDLAVFHNIINDMYLKDISKKIRNSRQTRFNQGKYMGTSAPFGYLKDPNNKNQLIIDARYVSLIKRIFELAKNGLGIAKIRKILTEEKIPRPAACACDNGANFNRFFDDNEENRYTWSNNSVRGILRNPTYAGHLVGYKRVSLSMKSKKRAIVPMEDWQIIENTHEAIVSQEDFDVVQRLMTSRRKSKPGSSGYDNIFSGIIKCADCGYAMRTAVANRKKKERVVENILYTCNNYTIYGRVACTNHNIEASLLHKVVLEDILKHSKMALENDEELLNSVLKSIDFQGKQKNSQIKKDLKQAEKRLAEVDKLFSQLYEDSVSNKITERNYSLMSKKYEAEQLELDAKIENLKLELDEESATVENVNLWIEQMKTCVEIEELSAPLLNSLIDRITVSEPKIIDNQKVQTVNIYYKFVGCIAT